MVEKVRLQRVSEFNCGKDGVVDPKAVTQIVRSESVLKESGYTKTSPP